MDPFHNVKNQKKSNEVFLRKTAHRQTDGETDKG